MASWQIEPRLNRGSRLTISPESSKAQAGSRPLESGQLLATDSVSRGEFMVQPRYLLVIADDFGIGPNTSTGILELAQRGLVTGTVLLVNAPFAEDGVRAWNSAGRPVELGWHPCLTLDAPILPPKRVPSLVDRQGRFWPLATFLKRLLLGWIAAADIEAELRAQYQRFEELVGQRPRLVNTHHHLAVFPPVGDILLHILGQARPLPYVRRLREPWRLLWQIPGARGKRTLLNSLGRLLSRRQQQQGFPGNDWLAGITDPATLTDPHFFAHWLCRLPGEVVELTCHPGHRDPTLFGRDGSAHDGLIQRRVDEYYLLIHPSFQEACRQAGFQLIPSSYCCLTGTNHRHAA